VCVGMCGCVCRAGDVWGVCVIVWVCVWGVWESVVCVCVWGVFCVGV